MKMTSTHRFGSLCIAFVLGFLTLFPSLGLVRGDDDPDEINEKESKQAEAYRQTLDELMEDLTDWGLVVPEEDESEEVAARRLGGELLGAIYKNMLYRQLEVSNTLLSLQEKIERFKSDDLRAEEARDALEDAKDRVGDFNDLNAARHVYWEQKVTGQLPEIGPDQEFRDADNEATSAINEVNLIVLRPARPGNVPSGDIVTDLIPTIIRQLFRFAFLAVLVSFVISSIYLIISFDEESRVTKAKHMIYYTLVGFAFIVMAFALVKAVTDIDFFGFI